MPLFSHITTDREAPKYLQLADKVRQAISLGQLKEGDSLPSVNEWIREEGVSRDTVFKAYTLLKEEGIIKAVDKKGYFVGEQTQRVFLLLDTLKAYKEVLFDSFVKSLPSGVRLDVHFHHYNRNDFKTMIKESIGRYSAYIVMPFDDPEMSVWLGRIPSKQLLVIDWQIHTGDQNQVLYQDFGQGMYRCLVEGEGCLFKYKGFHALYPSYTYHPKEALHYFERFCEERNIMYTIVRDRTTFRVQEGHAYLSFSDRMLGTFLQQCNDNGWEPGRETGIISYNDTPMKPFIWKGISVISTDFKYMGQRAADFVSSGWKPGTRECVSTKLFLRGSI